MRKEYEFTKEGTSVELDELIEVIHVIRELSIDLSQLFIDLEKRVSELEREANIDISKKRN